MTIDKTIASLKRKAARHAGRQPIKNTLHDLQNIVTDLRFDARVALEVGLTPKAERMIFAAAAIEEAISLIETHAINHD